MKDNGLYSSFKNKYPVTKTLKFELIPEGKTLENIKRNGLLKEDEERATAYREVKKMIDDCHREHIKSSLSNVVLDGIVEYATAYYDNESASEDLEPMAKKLREQIVACLTNPKEKYERLFRKDLIETDLPKLFEKDVEKQGYLNQFKRFTTYFVGFRENRRNMYSKEAETTAIAFRAIDQNLPKFLDNYKTLSRAFSNEELAEQLSKVEIELGDLLNGQKILDFFKIDNYECFLNQSGIDLYNAIIGGRSEDIRLKTKGINEVINLYKQTHPDEKIGLLKQLYNQILSNKTTLSFLDDHFTKDEDVLNSIKAINNDISNTVEAICGLFKKFDSFDLNKIYITNDGSIEKVSKEVYGDWSYIRSKLHEEYDSTRKDKNIKDYDKYVENRDKTIKKNKSISVGRIISLCGDKEIVDYCKNLFQKDNGDQSNRDNHRIDEAIQAAFSDIRKVLEKPYPEEKSLIQDKETVLLIKNYLDALKRLQSLIKPFKGTEKESEKDESFYGDFAARWRELDAVTPVYNMIRNYVTRKPYFKEKIKLNFKTSNLLTGWSKGVETQKGGMIFYDDSYYYLGIIDSKHRNAFKEMKAPTSKEDVIYKMYYYDQKAGQLVQNLLVIDGETVKRTGRKETAGERVGENVILEELKNKYLPSEINEIRIKRSYSKSEDAFNESDLVKYIDYYKERIQDYLKDYSFVFKNSDEYATFKDFTDHIDEQAYQLQLKEISRAHIDTMVEEGKLYLFKIYNKDFSEHSKGTPNLHTLYWKMLFNKESLVKGSYQLNGNAEVFYRKASIKENIVVHRANEPIRNKNDNNEKKESVFEYDIIKDKRYTEDKFQFHVPITLNYKADGKENINIDVMEAIRKADSVNVIGIDRGERNLIYVCVVDSKGNIIEQKSLNQIVTEHDGNKYKTDYHLLLSEREKRRDEERKNWQSIETIKELKEGYLSIVIHEIVKLAVKYNAIIVLEDLNQGFMRGRQKVEKQVYQSFERKLINKLNYLVDKNADPQSDGGLLNAYQLTGKFESFAKLGKQSGILFYTQAWNTSKIDPATGFVNLFDLRYKDKQSYQDFWKRFNHIDYSDEMDMFAFDFDYSNFTQKAEGTRNHWTLYSNGERIESKRSNDGQWTQTVIDTTEEIKKIFDDYGIDYKANDLKSIIVKNEETNFHRRLFGLFRLILQMRNSITNTNIDYIISPVMNEEGVFFDSRIADKNMPNDADANGAYNIARKGLIIVDRIQSSSDELKKVDLIIRNREWLRYAQGIE